MATSRTAPADLARSRKRRSTLAHRMGEDRREGNLAARHTLVRRSESDSKSLRYSTWVSLSLLLALFLPVRPASAGPEDLVAMERRFAAAVSAHGMRSGFGQFLAEDGILFRPRPVKGAEFLASTPEDPGLLEWSPAYARLAKSGDLGFTTGPWRYRESRTNTTLQATGQYLTVWQGTAGGWRVILDAGVGAPAEEFPWRVDTDGPDDPDEPLAGWQQTQRGRDLRYVDETYARRAAREGESVALDAHGHKRVRVLRSGSAPVVGRNHAVRFLTTNRTKVRDALQGCVVSGSGDLGCTWGEGELVGSGTTPTRAIRSWVRLWRRSGWSGTWRIALDLAADYPQPAAAAKP